MGARSGRTGWSERHCHAASKLATKNSIMHLELYDGCSLLVQTGLVRTAVLILRAVADLACQQP